MAKAYFKYKGVSSLDMHLQIENDISFTSPEADVDMVEVLGRDGELLVDNKRLKGTTFSIPVRIWTNDGTTVNEVATNISNWLKSDIGWHELEFSGSPDYVYTATMVDEFDIQETLKNFGRTVITFRMKPYKRKAGVIQETILSGQTLINEESRDAKPLIYIEGTGDITLQKNGEDWLRLKGVDEFIYIDSEMMSVYKHRSLPQFNKMDSTLKPMFPHLTVGENTITWTGNVAKVEINPRWEAIN